MPIKGKERYTNYPDSKSEQAGIKKKTPIKLATEQTYVEREEEGNSFPH